MKKRKLRKRRVINWDNTASNVVRGSREPYAFGPKYKPTWVEGSAKNERD